MAKPPQTLPHGQKHAAPIHLLRNVPLLAILNGPLPASILKLMEEDAKQILWALVPHLDDAVEGSARYRRWMKENVSYMPVKKGGGGIIHWPSHCDAYYATWIVRYLEPRAAPWKSIMRFYIQDDQSTT